jgi:hypothetical protein
MKYIFTILLSLTVVVRAHAAMVRVIAVQDGRTLIVEHEQTRATIRLAGVVITDATRATELLRWTVGTAWVLVEKHPSGEHLVYRSPDALFINRELVLRGYARATLHGIEPEPQLRVTYLGQWNPSGPALTAPKSPGSDRGTSPRSSAKEKPKSRKRQGRGSHRAPAGAKK